MKLNYKTLAMVMGVAAVMAAVAWVPTNLAAADKNPKPTAACFCAKCEDTCKVCACTTQCCSPTKKDCVKDCGTKTEGGKSSCCK